MNYQEALDYIHSRNKFGITAMGYRSRFGEIDVIAEDAKTVVFVEVKLRKNSDFAAAREFVDRKKQCRIISTAKLWLMENDCEKQPRFDVIEIYAPFGIQTAKPEINHIKNAFTED